jgi:hypothetical protein
MQLGRWCSQDQRHRPAPRFEERPYKWSRRLYDDPPVGTINYDGGRNPEIHIGNGEWQPLDAASETSRPC